MEGIIFFYPTIYLVNLKRERKRLEKEVIDFPLKSSATKEI
jgi:hypothetical protein